MDTGRQVYENEVSGWAAGIYEDIKLTFRSPVVNWIFRTLLANHPEFLRHAWGQCKPLFQTAACLDACREYRRELAAALGDMGSAPCAGRAGLTGPESRELRGQLATFDRVAPLLAVWYELLHRGLHDEPVGQAFAGSLRAATAPAVFSGYHEDCLPPVALSYAELPDSLDRVSRSISSHHAMPGRLATIHLCLAKWPNFLTGAWEVLLPVLESDAYEKARLAAVGVVKRFVDQAPYGPVLGKEALCALGFAAGDIDDVGSAVDYFYSGGPAETVIPTLPLFARLAGVGQAGPKGG